MRKITDFCLDYPLLGWVLAAILVVACAVLYHWPHDTTLTNLTDRPIVLVNSQHHPAEAEQIIIEPGSSITRRLKDLYIHTPNVAFEQIE